jgi:hypothetical protein
VQKEEFVWQKFGICEEKYGEPLSVWNISGTMLNCSQNDLPYCNYVYQKYPFGG